MSLIEMKERVNQRPLPVVDLVDMRLEFQETGKESIFSRVLLERAKAAIDRGEQAIILLNRRGYSFAVLCRACGEKLQCENCAIALTHHKPIIPGETIANPAGQRLKCHYCGYVKTVPKRCPKCESEHLFYLGAGSQQGEERLQELFPHARIGRMDRDTIRNRFDMEHLLDAAAQRADQPAGGHADDRQGPRYPRRHLRRGSGRGPCSRPAGFPRRRTCLPVAHPGLRPRRTRRSARQRPGPELLPGTLRHPMRGGA